MKSLDQRSTPITDCEGARDAQSADEPPRKQPSSTMITRSLERISGWMYSAINRDQTASRRDELVEFAPLGSMEARAEALKENQRQVFESRCLVFARQIDRFKRGKL